MGAYGQIIPRSNSSRTKKPSINNAALLTDTLVDGGVDNGAQLGEAGLPHNARWTLHRLGRYLLLLLQGLLLLLLGNGSSGDAVPTGVRPRRRRRRRARTGGPLVRSPPQTHDPRVTRCERAGSRFHYSWAAAAVASAERLLLLLYPLPATKSFTSERRKRWRLVICEVHFDVEKGWSKKIWGNIITSHCIKVIIRLKCTSIFVESCKFTKILVER